jgi:hypothetical protein
LYRKRTDASILIAEKIKVRKYYCWQHSAVCDQKTSKFSVTPWEESMAGHIGVNGVY